MSWNWQLPDWPKFKYESHRTSHYERKFLLESGSSSAILKNISDDERNQFVIEILSLGPYIIIQAPARGGTMNLRLNKCFLKLTT
ncbi:MAG: DUF4172 domain-containing protein [Parachlamydiaceae bacterium]|nr:DUF4172 domain-containing protein [Parachlamydiaceae bacterium]